MKKIIACISLMLFVSISIAQTQKEIDDLMKKMEDIKKEMPPEAKQMMDSMGLKMPDAKQMSLPKGMTMDKIQQKQKEMLLMYYLTTQIHLQRFSFLLKTMVLF